MSFTSITLLLQMEPLTPIHTHTRTHTNTHSHTALLFQLANHFRPCPHIHLQTNGKPPMSMHTTWKCSTHTQWHRAISCIRVYISIITLFWANLAYLNIIIFISEELYCVLIILCQTSIWRCNSASKIHPKTKKHSHKPCETWGDNIISETDLLYTKSEGCPF